MSESRKESAIEVKVGALVIFSLILLGGFIYVLGDFGFEAGSTIYVEYQDATGLKPGAAVKQAGIEIGKVRDIEYTGGEPSEVTGEPIWARVEVAIEEGRLEGIRETSEFYITTEGVLGEKYIAVRTLDPAAAAIEDGQVFRGEDPVRIEHVVSKVSKSLDSFNKLLNRDDLPISDLLAHIDQLVVHTDEILVENRERIRNILEHVDSLVVTADQVVEENRKPINSLLTNADQLAVDGQRAIADFRATMKKVDRIVEALDVNLTPVIERINTVAKSVDEFARTALRIAEDAEPKVATILDDAGSAVGNVEQASAQVASLTEYVYEGQGTVGLLIRDEEIFDNLREMLRELKRRPWKMVWKE